MLRQQNLEDNGCWQKMGDSMHSGIPSSGAVPDLVPRRCHGVLTVRVR